MNGIKDSSSIKLGVWSCISYIKKIKKNGNSVMLRGSQKFKSINQNIKMIKKLYQKP